MTRSAPMPGPGELAEGSSASQIDRYVGSRIQARRMALGRSLEHLAEAQGLTTAQWQQYEQGAHSVPASHLPGLARSLGVSIGFFFASAEPQGSGHAAAPLAGGRGFAEARDGFSAHPPETVSVGDPLAAALAAARARGDAFKQDLLTESDLLSTAEMAKLLSMSEEGIRLKRKRRELLGLSFAKRGIRYPGWQVLPNLQLLPGLPRLFDILGDDPWRLYRFLRQHHAETDGRTALEALRSGDIEAVMATAANIASGAYS